MLEKMELPGSQAQNIVDIEAVTLPPACELLQDDNGVEFNVPGHLFLKETEGENQKESPPLEFNLESVSGIQAEESVVDISQIQIEEVKWVNPKKTDDKSTAAANLVSDDAITLDDDSTSVVTIPESESPQLQPEIKGADSVCDDPNNQDADFPIHLKTEPSDSNHSTDFAGNGQEMENFNGTEASMDLYPDDSEEHLIEDDGTDNLNPVGDEESSMDPDFDAQDQNAEALSASQQKRVSRRADKALMDQLSFMQDFDPQIRSELKKRKRYTDGRATVVASDFDECDCLVRGCPGCHFPCKQCGERKCGHECRQGRRWVYESIEIEGRGKELKNHRFTTQQVQISKP